LDALFSHGNLILLEFSSNSQDPNLTDEFLPLLGKKCKTFQILIWRGAKNRIRPETVWEFFREMGVKFAEGPRSQLRLNFHFSRFDAEKFANLAPQAIKNQIEDAHAIGNRMLQFQNGTRIDY
jgi:hypothetical protein